MSLVQQLLLLSLVARFWREPYTRDLVRWGTQLHDKFMLPFHVWHDLLDVIDDMNRAGYELDASWFAPHFEFRFPLYGTVQLRRDRDRAAPGARAVARARRGGRDRRHRALCRLVGRAVAGQGARAHRRPLLIACNGWRVPLTATGRAGELVGGVRFRAWQPASSLHPTIPVDAPLTFDLYDRWSGRAVAGCTYHVAHPGGRNFERVPGQCLRGGEQAARALLSVRPHAPVRIRSRNRSRAASFRTHSICAGPTE